MSDTQLRNLEKRLLLDPANSDFLQRWAAVLLRIGNRNLSDGVKFLAGHWMTTPPKKPGLYFTKDRTHQINWSPIFIIADEDGNLTAPTFTGVQSMDRRPEDRWRGYWWSEPIPELPASTPNDESF